MVPIENTGDSWTSESIDVNDVNDGITVQEVEPPSHVISLPKTEVEDDMDSGPRTDTTIVVEPNELLSAFLLWSNEENTTVAKHLFIDFSHEERTIVLTALQSLQRTLTTDANSKEEEEDNVWCMEKKKKILYKQQQLILDSSLPLLVRLMSKWYSDVEILVECHKTVTCLLEFKSTNCQSNNTFLDATPRRTPTTSNMREFNSPALSILNIDTFSILTELVLYSMRNFQRNRLMQVVGLRALTIILQKGENDSRLWVICNHLLKGHPTFPTSFIEHAVGQVKTYPNDIELYERVSNLFYIILYNSNNSPSESATEFVRCGVLSVLSHIVEVDTNHQTHALETLTKLITDYKTAIETTKSIESRLETLSIINQKSSSKNDVGSSTVSINGITKNGLPTTLGGLFFEGGTTKTTGTTLPQSNANIVSKNNGSNSMDKSTTLNCNSGCFVFGVTSDTSSVIRPSSVTRKRHVAKRPTK